MKNFQKGIIAPVLLFIIALLVIGGGVYVYNNTKTETPLVDDVRSPSQKEKNVSVKLLSPNGGETFKVGDRMSIKWRSENVAYKKVYVGLTAEDGNAIVKQITDSLDGIPDTGEYFWTIDSSILPGNYRIIVQTDEKPQYAYDTSDTIFSIEKGAGLSDADFKKAVEDPYAKILAKGDINGDGYEDAIVQDVHCGASCGVSLQIVFNNQNKSVTLFKPPRYANFEPALRGSSAVKSSITNISIKDGIITLTGTALNCGECNEEQRKIVNSVSFRFDGKEIVQLSTLLKKPYFPKGTYEFGEGVPGQVWRYRMYLKNDSEVTPITLFVDGHMTMMRVYASGVSLPEGSLYAVNVVFDSYTPNNMMDVGFKKGDILFVLRPTPSQADSMFVEWKKLQPNLETSRGASTTFVKISDIEELE